MKKHAVSLILLLTLGQTACNTTMNAPSPPQTLPQGKQMAEMNQSMVPTGTPLAGSIETAMNETDRTKMLRALDNAPGKSTQWKNEMTGVSYTVTPVKKIVIKDNPYCREYNVTAHKGESTSQKSGVACVNKTGAWQSIS